MTKMHGANVSAEKLSCIELFWKCVSLFKKRTCSTNKGVLLIFLWNFSAFLVLGQSSTYSLKLWAGLLASMFVYPLTGWLADVYFSRYKVIKYSMWIMWCSTVAENIWILVKQYNHSLILCYVIEILCNGGLFVGLAGYLSNALQFTVDQVVDASSREISFYIRFHFWIGVLSYCTVVLTQNCFCSWFDKTLTYFIFPLSLTVSLVTDILLNKWLIKEPVTQNPLKLIYQVLHYAAKNKYPRLRSAFTYWEDKPYLRIDLAKTKYGGPFSTEQVENVKSFIRILLFAVSASASMGVFIVLYYNNTKLLNYYEDSRFIFNCTTSPNSAAYMNNCILRAVVGDFSMFTLLVFVFLFEWVLYSLSSKCKLCLGHCILNRFLLGTVLALVYCLSILGLEITTMENADKNTTLCLLEATVTDLLHHDGVQLDYKWLMLPQIFTCLSFYLLYTSGMEFVYAQTPYGMKGLVVGAVFFTCALSIVLSYSYIEVLIKLSDVSNFIKENCGLFYYGSVSAFSVFSLLAGIIMKKKYTLRRRDDDTHHEQIFAVEYFEKYINK